MGRWLIIQSEGEHRGQDGWTPNYYLFECHCFQYALRSLGHEADIWGPGHPNYTNIPAFDSYDFIICLQNYQTEWLPDLSQLKPKKIQWIVDAHVQSWDVYREISKGCDVILHATRSLMPYYKSTFPSALHLWFPCCIDERYINGPAREKTENLVFVGSRHPNRESFIRILEWKAGLKTYFATGVDMVERIASAKIHANQSISIDVNARVFETIGLGTCLLTNCNEALYDLGFRDGENCVLYQSIDEALVKIEALLQSGVWVDIGKAGFRLSRQHTYTARLKKLLAELTRKESPNVEQTKTG